MKTAGMEIYDELEGGARKDSNDPERMRMIVESTMRTRGNFDMTLYADGSVEAGVENGGAACVCKWKEEEIVKRKAAGKFCSSFVAETIAMRQAMAVIRTEKPDSAIICTDSLALVKTLGNIKPTMDIEVESLKEEMYRAAEGRRLAVQWIPSHVGIEGNEWADREANTAREEDQS